MSEKFVEFMKKYIGFMIGVIIGIIVVACGLGRFMLMLGLVLGFGFLGMYIQKNKSSVKVALKNLIEKW